MNEIVWKTPVASTAFLEGVNFSILSGRKCSIDYSFEDKENHSTIYERLIFDGLESFKCTYYKACSIEMIEAYDKVIDVGNSSWLEEIKNNLQNNDVNSDELKHLRIYFDDGPCYEFICRTFEVINGERKD